MGRPSESSDAASTYSDSTTYSYTKDCTLTKEQQQQQRRGVRQRVRDVISDMGNPPTAKQDAKDGKPMLNHIDVGPVGSVLVGTTSV